MVGLSGFTSPIYPPWIGESARTAGAVNVAAAGGLAWPTADKAWYLPWEAPFDVEIEALTTYAFAASGNHDFGVYDSAAVRLDSSGSVANSSGLNRWTPTTPIPVASGDYVYVALANSNNTTNFLCSSNVYGATAGMLARILGVYQQTTALPLPNPAVFATPSADFIPFIGVELVGIPTTSP